MRLRRLATDAGARGEAGQTVLDGEKLLREAIASGMEVTSVLFADTPGAAPEGAAVYTAPRELVEYASPVKVSPGPVFTVRIPLAVRPAAIQNAIVLENVQDPGNLGTIIRAADALGAGAVFLVGTCADLWSPRVVRASMGAVFRQTVLELPLEALRPTLREYGLPLYGAVLQEGARDVRTLPLRNAAVAVGNEGRGLSDAFSAQCDGHVIIPMAPHSESLNAAMAATILIWEMVR